jgi:quercetin dioxygenase-like cupin family protein
VASTGDTLTLPGGASLVVAKSAAETGGERVELELTLPPGSPSPPPHFHPRQEEQWRVLAGTVEVLVDGSWRKLAEGESVTIPAGTVHTIRNRSGGWARVLDVHVPALDFQEYMEDLSRLAAEGKITSLRSPRSLMYLASVLRAHRTTQLTASRAQRAAESALAALGRLAGARVR